MKTHWKKAFNKDYLGAWDLDDNKDLIATISHIEVREIKSPNGEKEKRNVAIFKEKIKPMILNVDSCKKIKAFTNSSYIDDWKNVSVQIYIKNNVKAFGEVTEGLRIRELQPNIKKVELKPGMEAWRGAIDFIKQGNTIDRIENKYILSNPDRELLLSQAI